MSTLLLSDIICGRSMNNYDCTFFFKKKRQSSSIFFAKFPRLIIHILPILLLWFYHSPSRLRIPFSNYTQIILLLCKINICIVLSRNEYICITRLPIECQDLIIFGPVSTLSVRTTRDTI